MVGTLARGGAERQLFYMLRALRQEGNRVTVLCLTKQEYWESPIRALGVPVVWVGRRKARLLRLLRIMREVRRLKPDVIQSSHFYTNIPVAVAGRAFGIPAIGAVRADCVIEVAEMGLLGKANLLLPRWIAANSKAGVQNAVASGVLAERVMFLPNVVDCDEFKVAPKAPHNPIRLMTAGRLVDQKRQDRFVKLIAELRSRVAVGIHGIIVGEGPKRRQLEDQGREFGLTVQDLEFLGVQQQMNELYGKVDIVVLTSDWEGTPNVLLEAMASGVPVVSTDTGDVRDIIQDGVHGFIVDKADDEALVTRVRQLVEDVALRQRFGENARRHIEQNFSVDRLSAYLDSTYRTVT